MTNEDLADLLEEAARRLKNHVAIDPGKSRETAEEFATRIQVTPQTVRRMCETSQIFARRLGRGWLIDVKKSELLLSIKYGNAAEADLARRVKRDIRKAERERRP